MKADLVIGGHKLDWQRIAEAQVDRAEAMYNAGLQNASRAVIRSLEGGTCKRCGTEWEAVEVDNIYATYRYYRPACNCYPRCRKMVKTNKGGVYDQGCGRKLWEELEAGVREREGHRYLTCGNCGVEIQVDRFG